jgi:hypothetical protein
MVAFDTALLFVLSEVRTWKRRVSGFKMVFMSGRGWGQFAAAAFNKDDWLQVKNFQGEENDTLEKLRKMHL